MLKITNPYAVVAILIGLLIIGILLGRNWEKWFTKKVETLVETEGATSPPAAEKSALPPATILIPYSPFCRARDFIYNYGGCTYTFLGYVMQFGRIKWCKMKRKSCP